MEIIKIIFIVLTCFTIECKLIKLSDCSGSLYGCCPNGITPAAQPNKTTCPTDDYDLIYDHFDIDIDTDTDERTKESNDSVVNSLQLKDIEPQNAFLEQINELAQEFPVLKLKNHYKIEITCAQSKYECCPDGVTLAIVISNLN
jgi:hypothetical protein